MGLTLVLTFRNTQRPLWEPVRIGSHWEWDYMVLTVVDPLTKLLNLADKVRSTFSNVKTEETCALNCMQLCL